MAGINPYDSQAEFTPLNYSYGFEAGRAQYQRHKDYQDKYDDFLGKMYVPALPQDTQQRNTLVKGYQQRLSDLTDKHKGDPMAIWEDPEFHKIKQQYTQDINYGKLGAIGTNYAKGQQYLSEVNKLNQSGKLSQDHADKLVHTSLGNYPGVGEQDMYGNYNSLNTITPAETQLLTEQANKLGEGWKANKLATNPSYRYADYDASGKLYFVKNTGEHEYADPKEIKTWIKNGLKNNQNNTDYVNQIQSLDHPEVHQLPNINEQTQLYTHDENGYPQQVNPLAYKKHLENTLDQPFEDASNFAAAKYGYDASKADQDIKFAPKEYTDKEGIPNSHSITLNSMNIPQNNALKVGSMNLGTENNPAVPYTQEEANAIYQKHGVRPGDNAGQAYDLAAAEIALGKSIPKDEFEQTQAKFKDDQNKVLQRYQEEFGRAPGTNEAKKDAINRYLDYHNKTLQYSGMQEYNFQDPKAFKAAQDQSKAFFDPKAGIMAGNNRNYYKMTGDNGQEKLAGNDFMKEFNDQSKYKTVVSGPSTPDNPYENMGNVVTVTDAKTGAEKGKYFMTGTNEENNDPRNGLLHSMYLAKYNVTGESEVPMTQVSSDGKKLEVKKYKLVYRNLSTQTDDKGEPIIEGHKAELIDPKTNLPVITVSANDPQTDVIQMLYNKAHGIQ